jgi:hypothetical protein
MWLIGSFIIFVTFWLSFAALGESENQPRSGASPLAICCGESVVKC